MRKRVPKSGLATTHSEMQSQSNESPLRADSQDYCSQESNTCNHRVVCNESLGSSTIINGVTSKEYSQAFSFPLSNQSSVLTEGPLPVNSGIATPVLSDL